MIYDGRNGGTIEVLENVVVIRRQGGASLLTQGLKGEKRIPFTSITSVQFKDAGVVTGYIQFGVLGGIESRGGVFNATQDENTVLFTSAASGDFHKLRDIIESRIGRPISQPIAYSNSTSFAEELTRLADLKDRGILTDDEFAQEKANLQTNRATNFGAAQHNEIQLPSAHSVSDDNTGHVDKSQELTQIPKTIGQRLGLGCVVIAALFLGLIVLATMSVRG